MEIVSLVCRDLTGVDSASGASGVSSVLLEGLVFEVKLVSVESTV